MEQNVICPYPPPRKPTHLDLFSGIGGFKIAAQAAGFRTIGFSEIDPYASAVLKKHWPEIINYGDIRAIPDGRCDLITGGFPCQPFSTAGHRRGADDDRFLWPSMFDVIKRWKPYWVLGENVVNLVNMELEGCLVDLEGIGYEVQSIVIPACGVGARHRRDRVWIVAHAVGERLEGQCQVGATSRATHGPSNECNPAIWPVEPAICRVVNGIPNRPHRLKGLGNAIVPQIAEIILKEMRKFLP
jgi:DNA (cytosine-5)-methyltransferase 1